jgi:hypothetical protein
VYSRIGTDEVAEGAGADFEVGAGVGPSTEAGFGIGVEGGGGEDIRGVCSMTVVK